MSTGAIVFVTTELPPAIPGGAGYVIDDLARRLVAIDQPTTVLVASSLNTASWPKTTYDLVHVASADPRSLDDFIEQSRAIANTLATMEPDRVEFHDFNAPAFWTLTHREELGLVDTPISVRFHGPVGEILSAVGGGPDLLRQVAKLERHCLRMADAVIVPSDAMARYVEANYQSSSVVVSALPMPHMSSLEYSPPDEAHFVFYGRTNEVKGPDLFAEAIALTGARGTFVGPDGWSLLENRPMSEVLGSNIPATGPVDRFDIEPFRSTTAVVISSRFETFCLAAYEARAKGLPIILADLPAYEDIWDVRTGALICELTAPSIAAAMQSLVDNPTLALELAKAPLPVFGDPLAAYQRSSTKTHPQAQAGLATAALATLGDFSDDSLPRLQGLMRLVPAPLARSLVRVLPQSVKDRIRKRANWNIETAKRAASRRTDLFQDRLTSFVEDPRPAVSVIIPCYNQGEFLMDAIMSVFEQTESSFEIVIVDDGSTDEATAALLDRIHLPSTTVIRQENAGLPAARNAGIMRARGRYVVPLDADDELTPGYLSMMMKDLDDSPTLGFVHCWAEIYGDVEYIWATRPFNLAWMLVENSVVGCAMIRRSALGAVGYYDSTMKAGNEDWELWLRLSLAGWGSKQIRQPLFRYRKHGHTMSVDTESAFELGRASVLSRNALNVSAIAKAHAPAIAHITGGELGEIANQLRRTGAKYVTMTEPASADVDHCLSYLEEHPNAANATSGPATVWRRWALLDSDSGHDRVSSSDVLSTVQLTDWDLPEALEAVKRQVPEVSLDAWNDLA